MRLALILFALSIFASAQSLRVKSATAHKVELDWTGTSSAWTIERKVESGKYEKLDTVSTTAFRDTKIDPYATYTYRVSAAAPGKPSNEVIVGPPPAGVLVPAPMPANKTLDPAKYGTNTAPAFDENGDPAVALLWSDPNGDGIYTDTNVQFVRWNRAAHAWVKAVNVVVTGEIPSQGVEPVSLACDTATGTLVIATPVFEKGLVLAISKDGGATWTTAQVPGVAGTVSSTSLAIHAGRMHLAFNETDAGIKYFTGAIDDDPSKWKIDVAPVSSGWKPHFGVNVTLAMDAAFKPAIAWYETKEDAEDRRFMVWHGEGNPVAALQVPHANTDFPSAAINTGGGRFGLLFNTPMDQANSDAGIWYTSSADTSTWTKPVLVPVDGPRSTNAPQSVAIDSHGRIVAAFGSNSGSGAAPCGAPMVSRSADGVRFTTCGLGRDAGAEFGPQPNTIHVLFAGNDKAYILWQEPAENKYGQGVLLWHER